MSEDLHSLSYTAFGQIAQVSECIEGETFTTSYEYNDIGQEKTVSYPSPAGSAFGVKYHYTSLGFLHSVNDAADDKVLWSVTATDASGHVTSEFTRNGVETISDRNPVFGWLMSSTATAHASADGTNDTTIQSWTNHYDIAGNLRQRLRSQPSSMGDSVETFDYDNLDRLLSAEVVIDSEHYKAKETFGYDTKGLGNLTLKADKTLSYTGCTTGGGPHAVCSVNGGTAFSYDPNGNLTKGNDHTVTYTPTNKIKHIEGKLSAPGGSSPTVDYAYGADGTRVMQSVGTTVGDETARTVYVGMGGTGKSLYERTTSRESIEHVHFVYAGSAHGGSAFALRVVTSDRETPESVSPPTFRYQHFDHLGSITASTDDLGHVVGASGGPASTVLGYDAWGKRRSPDGQPSSTSLSLQPGHREFTGHETIPQVGLVNMNGRVYDPDLGRFLSPDPNVQFVANLQSYNRYTYVLNNPLRYTDPTGYFINSTFDIVVNMAFVVVGAVACAGTAGGGCVAAFALASAVYNTSSAINGGMGWSNAVGVGLMSMAVSGVAGSGTGLIVGEAGATLAGQMVAGAVAGATSSGIMAVAFNRGDLGNNVLMGALSGAMGAALAYAGQSVAVSEASAAEQQGEGTAGVYRPSKSRGDDAVVCGSVGGACETPDGTKKATFMGKRTSRDDIDNLALDNADTLKRATNNSIRNHKTHEYGYDIYRDSNKDLQLGKMIESTGSRSIDIPTHKGAVGYIHSHPDPLDSFSLDDLRWAGKGRAYMVNTTGDVLMYDGKAREIWVIRCTSQSGCGL